MPAIFQRTELLLGPEKFHALQQKRVALFGVGGVGGVCAEALVRSGLLHLTLVDFDVVSLSNINRQLPALHSTVGQAKVQVLAERFKDISPDLDIQVMQKMYSSETNNEFDWSQYDVVIDAIDSVQSKIDLIIQAHHAGCVVYSSLGAAWKLDPTQIRVSSIWKTKSCPLGKLVRIELRKRGFEGDFLAVYSEEKRPSSFGVLGTSTLGSMMPVTASFGMTLASLVIKNV